MLGEAALREFIDIRGSNLSKLCIQWMNTTVNCLYDQISAEFIYEILPKSCPVLTVLDVSGLKNITGPVLQQFLDTKLYQVSVVLTNKNSYKIDIYIIEKHTNNNSNPDDMSVINNSFTDNPLMDCYWTY